MAKPTWNFSSLQVEPIHRYDKHGCRYKRLLEPFTAKPGFSENGNLGIHVPAGFETNYASTPRWAWIIFPPDGRYAEATVIHDYHYATRQGLSRFFADALFRDHMAALGVPWWKRCAMYYAVRLFSWRHWR